MVSGFRGFGSKTSVVLFPPLARSASINRRASACLSFDELMSFSIWDCIPCRSSSFREEAALAFYQYVGIIIIFFEK